MARDGGLDMQDLIQRLRPNVCPIARTLHEGRDLLQMVGGEFDVKRRETTRNDMKRRETKDGL